MALDFHGAAGPVKSGNVEFKHHDSDNGGSMTFSLSAVTLIKQEPNALEQDMQRDAGDVYAPVHNWKCLDSVDWFVGKHVSGVNAVTS